MSTLGNFFNTIGSFYSNLANFHIAWPNNLPNVSGGPAPSSSTTSPSGPIPPGAPDMTSISNFAAQLLGTNNGFLGDIPGTENAMSKANYIQNLNFIGSTVSNMGSTKAMLGYQGIMDFALPPGISNLASTLLHGVNGFSPDLLGF